MKEDRITINSDYSLDQIQQKLRDASNKLKANVDRIEADPFDYQQPDIAVKLSQKNFFFGPREWVVNIYVTEMGAYRKIVLIALGESIGAKITSGFAGYHGQKSSFYELRDSIDRRDFIAKCLK